jgi:hypothetical protein
MFVYLYNSLSFRRYQTSRWGQITYTPAMVVRSMTAGGFHALPCFMEAVAEVVEASGDQGVIDR